MNTDEDKEATGESPAQIPESPLALDFDLAPAWARESPDAHHRRFADDARGGDEGRPQGRDNRRPGFGRDRRPPLGRDDRRGPSSGRGPRPAGRNERPPRRDERRPVGDDRRSDDRRDFRPVREEPPLPLDVRVLPDQKALGAIIRRIQTTHRAYPLRDIARLFLDNPAAHQLRIEPVKGQSVPLFQCRVCGLPGLSEEEIRSHALSTHLRDFFDIEDIETDPPAGHFVCIARCGISGELLGPPNHHSFNARVQELLRTRFAHMSADTYRGRIEMVRDPETVEQWRQQARKKQVFRRKQPAAPQPTPPAGAAAADDAAAGDTAAEAPPAPPLDRQVAERIFASEILPGQILAVKHLVCPAAVARHIADRRLAAAVREALFREQKFPASLFFALRGAFRHRELHLFRANHERGPDFVVVRQPVALDASHVVSELRQVLGYIDEHPGCTRQELLQSLGGGDEARAAHYASQLNTLVEKAHVIEFYNGALCPPMEHPIFKMPGDKAPSKPPPAARPEGAPPTPAAVEPPPAPEAEPAAKPATDAVQP